MSSHEGLAWLRSGCRTTATFSVHAVDFKPCVLLGKGKTREWEMNAMRGIIGRLVVHGDAGAVALYLLNLSRESKTNAESRKVLDRERREVRGAAN